MELLLGHHWVNLETRCWFISGWTRMAWPSMLKALLLRPLHHKLPHPLRCPVHCPVPCLQYQQHQHHQKCQHKLQAPCQFHHHHHLHPSRSQPLHFPLLSHLLQHHQATLDNSQECPINSLSTYSLTTGPKKHPGFFANGLEKALCCSPEMQCRPAIWMTGNW